MITCEGDSVLQAWSALNPGCTTKTIIVSVDRALAPNLSLLLITEGHVHIHVTAPSRHSPSVPSIIHRGGSRQTDEVAAGWRVLLCFSPQSLQSQILHLLLLLHLKPLWDGFIPRINVIMLGSSSDCYVHFAAVGAFHFTPSVRSPFISFFRMPPVSRFLGGPIS